MAASSFEAQRPCPSIAVNPKAACPARTKVIDALGVEQIDVAQLEAQGVVRAPNSLDVPLPERRGGPIGADSVSFLDRDGDLEGTRWRDEASDRRRRGLVQAKRAAKQRAPWEPDRDQGRDPVQLARQRLHPGRNEHGVGQTALLRVPSGPAGGLGHGAGVGIHADRESRGIGSRCREDGAAVTGSKVDDGPAMSPGQCGQLADVDVDDPTAGHDAHGAQYARIRQVAPG